MKRIEKNLGRLLFLALIFFVPLFSQPHQVQAAELDLEAKAAIAIDAESGKIFYEKNSEEPLPIASMTKLLTMYLILEAEANGQIAWDEQVEISDHLESISQDLNLSNINLIAGRTYSVRDLFNASALISANAAVTALAEHVAGSEKDFVDLMRKKIELWGITDAYLISTSGLNNEDVQGRTYPGSKENEENLMSAKDVAFVAQQLVNDFPDFLEISKQPAIMFAPGTDEEAEMFSSNWMLPTFPDFKEGVDGLKTGTTDLAGRNFAGTIKQDGLRLITIVMGLPIDEDDQRFKETATLMDYVYNNWQLKTLYQAGEQIKGHTSLPIAKGKEPTVPVILTDDLTFWVEKSMTRKLTVNVNWTEDKYPKGLVAPLAKDELLATLDITLPEDTLGYLTKEQQVEHIQVKSKDAVQKANVFVLAGRGIKTFFENIFT